MADQKLPKAFKKKYLKALRSGDYKQTTDQLVRDGCYCCLGVAGIVCGLTEKEMRLHGSLWAMGEAGDNTLKVPKMLTEHGRADNATGVLMRMNDAGRKSFKEIADYIDENL